jgi:hypothetical protein
MMNFYRLDHDRYIKGRWQLDGPVDDENRNENEFWQGESIALRGPLRIPLWSPGTPLDFTMTVSSVPVLSKRLADAVRALVQGHAQLFPVDIEGYHDYEVLNVTERILCMDERRAEFTKWTVEDGRPDKLNHYQMVMKLRIDAKQVPSNMHVFRIKYWELPLIVSQAFVDAILPLNPIGPKLELVT